MSTIEQILASSAQLVTLPAVYLEVKRVVDDPRSTPIDLANALSADPVMAARVLRLVNSAFWGLRGGIDSLSRAVSLLGMIHIHDLVLASSVVQTFERVPPRLMVDCSHGNSGRDPERQPAVAADVAAQVAAGQRAICGVMLESYLLDGAPG